MVSIVFVRTDSESVLNDRWIDLLSDEEKLRLSRFRREEDQSTYLVAHVTKRLILASELNLSSPLALKFRTNAYGKPYLDKHAIHFNLSHTDGMIALAWSGNSPIGVDIENLLRHPYDRKAAQLVLSESELEDVDASNHQVERFLEYWTMKEAAAKGEGKGLQLDFRKVNLLEDRIQIGESRWKIECFHPSNQHIAALATTESRDTTDIRNYGTLRIEQLLGIMNSNGFAGLGLIDS